ncbi:sulfotransferase-like domain-containing protein [Streptomyces xanthophaeus]
MSRTIALWAVPRSASTVFEKTFACRVDTRIAHEPFTDCYYFGSERRSQRYGQRPERADHCGARACAELEREQGHAPVLFIKDLAFQAGPYLPDSFLARIRNTFILRHPRTVLRSLLPLKPDFTEDEFGFTALEGLFRRVVDDLGHEPIVVDGDDFRRSPEAVLRRYCAAVGLPFSAAMLHWQDGRIRAWSEGEAQSQAKWHRTLESSHCVLPPAEHEDVPVPRTREGQYERALEIYETIRSHHTNQLPDRV